MTRVELEQSPELLKPLAEWFAVATDGLARFEKRKLFTEVFDHVEQAVGDDTEGEASREEAIDHAVRALGDPKRARKGFRKTHVTETEERRLYFLETWPHRLNKVGDDMKKYAYASLAVLVGLIFWYWTQGGLESLLDKVWLLWFLCFPLIYFMTQRTSYLCEQRRFRRYIAWFVTFGLISTPMMLILAFDNFAAEPFLEALTFCCAIGMIVVTWRLFRLRKKLPEVFPVADVDQLEIKPIRLDRYADYFGGSLERLGRWWLDVGHRDIMQLFRKR